MQAHPRFFSVLGLLIGSLSLLAIANPATPVWADEVYDWNIAGFAIAEAGGQHPILVSRTMAMMHLAIHDALNAIDRRYEPYLAKRRAESSAAPGAAVAAAAHDVLAGVLPQFGTPEQRAKALGMLETTYTAALAKIPDGVQKQQGIAVGQAAASAMLTARQQDKATRALAVHAGYGPWPVASTPQPGAAESPCRQPRVGGRQYAGPGTPLGHGDPLHDGPAMAVPPARPPAAEE